MVAGIVPRAQRLPPLSPASGPQGAAPLPGPLFRSPPAPRGCARRRARYTGEQQYTGILAFGAGCNSRPAVRRPAPSPRPGAHLPCDGGSGEKPGPTVTVRMEEGRLTCCVQQAAAVCHMPRTDSVRGVFVAACEPRRRAGFPVPQPARTGYPVKGGPALAIRLEGSPGDAAARLALARQLRRVADAPRREQAAARPCPAEEERE